MPAFERPEEPQTSADDNGSEEPRSGRLDPLFYDSTLWPLLFVGVVTLATFGAALVSLAVVDRSLPAMGAVALLFGVTLVACDGERRKRGLTPALWLVAVVWGLSVAGAFAYAWWITV